MSQYHLEQDIILQKYILSRSYDMPFSVNIRKRIVNNCINLYLRYIASAKFDYHGILSIADCIDKCLDDPEVASVVAELKPKKRLVFNNRRNRLVAKSLYIYHFMRKRLKLYLRQ